MSYYWRLQRRDYYYTAMTLKRLLPELKNSDTEVLTDNLRGSNLVFYKEEKVLRPTWIRFTLPFAIVVGIIALILAPINFLFTGRWGYKTLWLTNWFRALGF